MPLYVKAWAARMMTFGGGGSGEIIYLPFDRDFKHDQPTFDNRLALSKIGRTPSWYIFVDFTAMDPENPDYPHYVELHDNEDFATFQFEAHWSERAGLQHGHGPVPTAPGKRHVRLVLLNKEKKPLLSQSGDFYVEPG
jgi:hypothetical protein